ncbi:hypothetical protein H2200_008500 [Cladophialophora chaetospira]|uniref:DNA2/NAM7 helicase-like C-terminal domain-containing protein n=1 Tax=Cladophialophora chaetospira TaxID=386627 RepID=A0AA38X625_9EURO|nr:hypothetical protein H2200_008500 [Cladophialophora chaetospira]
MLESGYRTMCKYVREDSSRGQWDPRDLEATADIRTIHGARGSEQLVTILNMTKSGDALRKSTMTGPRLVNVATSRMKDFLFTVGHWDSVVSLPVDNALRQVMLFWLTAFPTLFFAWEHAP